LPVDDADRGSRGADCDAEDEFHEQPAGRGRRRAAQRRALGIP
jgi:hypothetical protein